MSKSYSFISGLAGSFMAVTAGLFGTASAEPAVTPPNPQDSIAQTYNQNGIFGVSTDLQGRNQIILAIPKTEGEPGEILQKGIVFTQEGASPAQDFTTCADMTADEGELESMRPNRAAHRYIVNNVGDLKVSNAEAAGCFVVHPRPQL